MCEEDFQIRRSDAFLLVERRETDQRRGVCVVLGKIMEKTFQRTFGRIDRSMMEYENTGDLDIHLKK